MLQMRGLLRGVSSGFPLASVSPAWSSHCSHIDYNITLPYLTSPKSNIPVYRPTLYNSYTHLYTLHNCKYLPVKYYTRLAEDLKSL